MASTMVSGRVPMGKLRQATVGALLQLEKKIHGEMERRQDLAFINGGHHMHGGRKWVPLSPLTVALKRRLGSPTPFAPLMRTGAMSGATNVEVELESVAGSVQFTMRAVNRAPYSGFHMYNAFNTWTGRLNPIRNVVEFTQQDLQWVAKLIQSQFAPAIVQSQPKPSWFQRARGAVSGFLSRLFRRGR